MNILKKNLMALSLVFCLPLSMCYAQEGDLSLVVLPVKSTMLSKARIQEQFVLELNTIQALNESEREALYESIPDRTLDESQSRFMTFETQKTCKGVAKEYKIDIRFVASSALHAYWNFGDGKPSQHVPIPPFAGTLTANYVYDTPGVYTIEIEFFDGAYRPVAADEKKIKVIVEACTPPAPPQLPVNPNIHKISVE